MANTQPRAPERERRKRLRTINASIGTSQTERVLVDLTGDGSERETLVGIKGNLYVRTQNSGTMAIAIVKIPKGVAADTLATTDNGEDFYAQTENLLWSDLTDQITPSTTVGGITMKYEIDVKSKRKLRPGDKISMLMLNEVANGAVVTGVMSAFTLE